jgi:hypothetical protein
MEAIVQAPATKNAALNDGEDPASFMLSPRISRYSSHGRNATPAFVPSAIAVLISI